MEIVELLDLGNGVSLTVVDPMGRPAGTDYDVQMRLATVAESVEGLIERTTGYRDIDEARAAAERLAQASAWHCGCGPRTPKPFMTNSPSTE